MNPKYILLITCCTLFFSTFAQHNINHPDTVINGHIYTYVQRMPKPKFNMASYLSKNLQYPDEARKNNIQGRVIIRFIVATNGSIDSVTILKGIGGGCDEEAARVISHMPKWRPGKKDGKKVEVYFTQPINFKLE